MMYRRKEEKILFTYICNMHMVLSMHLIIFYGEKEPQNAPKAAKMLTIAPRAAEALV
jgi:hypothetical protein